MTGRVGRSLTVIGAVLVTVGAMAMPAQAAEQLELSSDGTHWSGSLPDEVFDVPQFAVPGDVITSELWVRNSSELPTRVQLTVADDLGSAPGRLAGELSLAIDGTPAVGGELWVGPALPAGAAVRISLVVTVSTSARGAVRLDTTSVLSTVSLVQTGPGTVAAPGGARPPSGNLARTGLDAARALAAATGAVGLGVLLTAAGRRRHPTHD